MQFIPEVSLKFIEKSSKIIVWLFHGSLGISLKNFHKLFHKFSNVFKITSYFSSNSPPIFLNFPENYAKFLPTRVENLFEKLFPISSKLYPNFFEDFKKIFQFFPNYLGFLTSSLKFLLNFLKTITFFRILKFYQKLQNSNFCTPTFPRSFFRISSQLIIIWSYTIMSAKPLQKTRKFSRHFRPNSKCLSTFLKIVCKVTPVAYQKNYSFGKTGSLKMPTKSLSY